MWKSIYGRFEGIILIQSDLTGSDFAGSDFAGSDFASRDFIPEWTPILFSMFSRDIHGKVDIRHISLN